MPDEDDPLSTRTHQGARVTAPQAVRGFALHVIAGPEKELSYRSSSASCSIGSHKSNDLVVSDTTVSRFHCEVAIGDKGATLRDLGSLNGTFVDGVRVTDAYLRNDATVRLGATVFRFQLRDDTNELDVSERTRFGHLVGASSAMRRAFALLEKAARSNATVLLQGETGTGKGQAALSIHEESARKHKPMLTLDCGAIPPNLLESELFGHERGAFTGATSSRAGVLEAADGGTVFLDEIGETSLDLQPKLLRVLENREVRRVGSNHARPVDVRIIAATNRDLRAEVNEGRFRSDLYFRIAVLKITLPALREHKEDLPALVDTLLGALGADADEAARMRTPEFLELLARQSWPGNVRELRNCVERALVFQDLRELQTEAPAESAEAVDARLPLTEARQRAIDAFERAYLEALVAEHEGKMSRAAHAAGIGRVYLYKLMKRHGLK